MNTLKTLKEAEIAYRKTNSLGYKIKVAGVTFYMESYDMRGRELIYQNKKTKQTIYIITANRYESTADAKFELI